MNEDIKEITKLLEQQKDCVLIKKVFAYVETYIMYKEK